MPILALIPTRLEFNLAVQACDTQGLAMETRVLGKLTTTALPTVGLTLAPGGLGKTQFALQTQHLLDIQAWDAVICAGAGGALSSALAVGDVVIATETVEHDIRNRFGPPLLPRFPGAPHLLAQCETLAFSDFRLHFGPIASGDEDVVDAARRTDIQAQTGAWVVAWEGAGGARAGQFSAVPYLEIRGVSDEAGPTAPQDFAANLPTVMAHVMQVVVRVAEANK